MKSALVMLAVAGSATLSLAAHADTAKPVALWQCSDYLSVNESVQPTVLGFAEAVNRSGNPQEAVLDVAGIAKLQPQVVHFCKENPKIALRDALIQTWPKAKQ